MSYIVLARKWRPQTFADLVGQQHIAVTLQNAIMQNRVAHAFLFTGSRGVGKTSSARIFAKALNCSHAPCEEPCNECISCREITEGHSQDVIEIDGASNRGINEIRNVLEAVLYAPARDRYKIYIIDEVHMLTTEAFNALLKTLEEPPPHVIFIFATTDPNKIPITIVSRCQRYDFKRITNDDLVAHLSKIAHAEGIEFESSALNLIARTARGGVRDALSAMDQVIAFASPPITGERAAEVLGVATRETLTKMLKAVLDGDVASALECIARVEHFGQNLSVFAYDLLEFLRDATVIAVAPNDDVPTQLSEAEKNCVKSWIRPSSKDKLQRVFNIWYQTTDALAKSLAPRLALEMAAIRMCQVEVVPPIDGILRRLDAITHALGQQISLPPDTLEHLKSFLSLTPAPISAALETPTSTPLDEKKKPDAHALTPPNTASEPLKTHPEPNTQISNSSSTSTTFGGAHATNDASNAPRLSRVSPSSPSHPSSDATSNVPTDDFDMFENASHHTSDDAFQRVELEIQDAWNTLSADDEDDSESDPSDAIDEKNKKTLEVSYNRPKTSNLDSVSSDSPDGRLHAWKQIVEDLPIPLSTIMAKALVRSFSAADVDVNLPSVYKDIVTPNHISEIERRLRRKNSPECRFSIAFDLKDEEADTLAAREAKRDFQIQEQAIDRLKSNSIFKGVCERFAIRQDSIRFTFNPNRTSP